MGQWLGAPLKVGWAIATVDPKCLFMGSLRVLFLRDAVGDRGSDKTIKLR
ncbi:MAG: hypothetical protein AAGD25_20995 [Cyanobacteria bacterium P01_F01_bin.150]